MKSFILQILLLTQKGPFPIGNEARDVAAVLLEHEVHLEPVVCPASKLHLAVLEINVLIQSVLKEIEFFIGMTLQQYIKTK